jgi:hypothetical protein
MSFKQISQLFDAPLAIVVGAVVAVLAAGQIGASGLAEQDDSVQAAQIDRTARLQRTAVINCLGVSGDAAHQACVRSQRATMGLDPEGPSSDDAPRAMEVSDAISSSYFAAR